jgi:hypothetical protein
MGPVDDSVTTNTKHQSTKAPKPGSCPHTRAHARARTHTQTHTQTDRHSRKCLTVALPPHPAPSPSLAARSRRGRPGTRAIAWLLLVLTPARQRSGRPTRCACCGYAEEGQQSTTTQRAKSLAGLLPNKLPSARPAHSLRIKGNT